MAAAADRNRRALGALLKIWRQNFNETQVGLAKRLGKPQSYVTKYENGLRPLEIFDIVKIGTALGKGQNAILKDLSAAVSSVGVRYRRRPAISK